MSRPKLKLLDYLSPTGAGIVIICFFLPWLRVSCGGKNMTFRGANLGWPFWIILGAALLMVMSFIYFKKQGKLGQSKFFMFAGSLLSLGIMVYHSIKVIRDPNIPFYVPSGMVNFELKFGSVGTILGLLLIIWGAILLGKQETQKTEKVAERIANE